MSLLQYLSLKPEEKESVKRFRKLYSLVRSFPGKSIVSVNPPPRRYKPVREGRRFIEEAKRPLEKRIDDIEPELVEVFDFALEHPSYRSKKLRNVLDHYWLKFSDYREHNEARENRYVFYD